MPKQNYSSFVFYIHIRFFTANVMANSGIQIIGYVLALGGLAASIAATFMVEWKRDAPKEGENNSMSYHYLGLWESCSVDRTGTRSCKPYTSIIHMTSKSSISDTPISYLPLSIR